MRLKAPKESSYVLFTFVSFKASNMYLNESVHKIDRKHTGSQRSGTKGRWIWRLLGEQEVVRAGGIGAGG